MWTALEANHGLERARLLQPFISEKPLLVQYCSSNKKVAKLASAITSGSLSTGAILPALSRMESQRSIIFGGPWNYGSHSASLLFRLMTIDQWDPAMIVSLNTFKRAVPRRRINTKK
jgi:hypothetical protein